jgi:hypothetical protein
MITEAIRIAGHSSASGRFMICPQQSMIRPVTVFDKEIAMNEDALNTSLRRFLKVVGVTSQREIELAIREAIAEGRLKGSETLSARVVLTLEKVGLSHTIDGTIELQ